MTDSNLKFYFYYKVLSRIMGKLEKISKPMVFWHNNELISYGGKDFWKYAIHRRINTVKNRMYSQFPVLTRELEAAMDYIIHGMER